MRPAVVWGLPHMLAAIPRLSELSCKPGAGVVTAQGRMRVVL